VAGTVDIPVLQYLAFAVDVDRAGRSIANDHRVGRRKPVRVNGAARAFAIRRKSPGGLAPRLLGAEKVHPLSGPW
jgi:hypothetical protein